MEDKNRALTYWQLVWGQFHQHPIGIYALYSVCILCFLGVYAPFFASSQPFVVTYHGEMFSPFSRYLFYSGFYTKPLDIFFNLLIITIPLFFCFFKLRYRFFLVITLQIFLFLFLQYRPIEDPASDILLSQKKLEAVMSKDSRIGTWEFELEHMNTYARLKLLLKDRQLKLQHQKLEGLLANVQEKKEFTSPTLWQLKESNRLTLLENYQTQLSHLAKDSKEYHRVKRRLLYLQGRQSWIEGEESVLSIWLCPLIRSFHWEEDAGGAQELNQHLNWWHLTRINRKDLVAGLLFGIRISMTVGILAIFIALLIGLPIGAVAGYFGGKIDIIISRWLEVWEALPTFFMLLMCVSILQSKSIFLVVFAIGFFGWTGFSRFLRAEVFKQRNLPYVDACRALGYGHSRIMFIHILPNALPPILTLMPFAILGAISSEAGLSFLGLGEEGSCSLGVLMDEGRTAFPGESYLLWPPAIVLSLLLVSIALIGDALRDALDPKMHR